MNPGSGHPHIMCPIDRYMRTTQKISEEIKRFFRIGVS